MTFLYISILVVFILTSDAKKPFLDDKLTYRKNIVDFKVAWCETRLRRYDWKKSLGQCLKFVPWDAKPLSESLQTRADKSYVRRMDIKPAGLFSRIHFQSVSVLNRNKRFGGDSWRVNIRGPSSTAATVYDKNDGSYEAVFLLEMPGSYWAEIILDYSLCEGFKDPPLDWFMRGCRHGSFQPPGSLGERTHDFLQELLSGGRIEFTVPASSLARSTELADFKAVSQSVCREKCHLLQDGFGSWVNEQWSPQQTGPPRSLGSSRHQQGRGVLWIYGDSLNRYFYQSLLNRPLCWRVFRACYHTMLWVYVLTQSAKDEMSLLYGGKVVNIPRILYELQKVVTRSDMDSDSALILNAGVHLLKSVSFYYYQKIINGLIGVLKRYYPGTVIWKTTTSIHDQRQLYSGCFRRFHTEQRVQLFNSYANWAMCRAGFLVLDVYPLSSSYPGGTLDGVHFKDSVFQPAIDALESYFHS